MFRDAQNVNFAISAHDIREALDHAMGQPMVALANVPKAFGGGISRGVHSPILDQASEEAKKFCEGLERERDQRLEQVMALEADLDKESESLKQAIVSLDASSERDSRRRIREIAFRMGRLIDEPFVIPQLDPDNLRTGEIGHLGGCRFKTLQVVDKTSGTALMTPLTLNGRLGKSVVMENLDLSSVVDDDFVTIRSSLVFEVKGTRTYTTVVGSTNTVFELSCFFDADEVRAKLLEHRSKGWDEPSLTEDEQKRLEANRQRRDAERRQKAHDSWQVLEAMLADGVTKNVMDELREFASQYKGTEEAIRASNEVKAALQLSLAKQLSKGGKRQVGDRWLQEIIDKWPNTAAAEEAAELLKEE